MKTKKKMMSLLLAVCMVLSLMPTTALAEESTVATWDGSADTSWYTGHESDVEYHIRTAEQLAGLAQLVNDKTTSTSFAGKKIYLDNDLDLSGHQWSPIGTGSNFKNFFAGVLDGQNHKIMNLYHHTVKNDFRNGLFGIVSDGGTIKNLFVLDADIVSNDDSLLAGILADWVNDGTVENCYTSGKIENNEGNKFLGGLIGQCTAGTQVRGCGTDANVVSTFTGEDCDTVGGLIGQWENSTDDSRITDCWFGGTVSCQNKDSAVGGILGANFDFRGEPGVKIENCMMATKNITCSEPGNITWITAAVTVPVKNCIWPDTPPDGVTLDEETYPAHKGTYLAVTKLVVDLNAGTASADPTFDQFACGKVVSDFTSTDVLTGLQTNASTGITWVAGVKHLTFDWDIYNIPADNAAVDAALAKVNDLNKSEYKNFSAVEDAVKLVDRTKSKAQQAEVDAMAKAIEDALAALEKKPASSGGSYVPVQKPEIITGEGGKTDLTDHGSTLVITPDTGMQIEKVLLNGKEVKVSDHKVKGLKTGDKVEVTFSRIPPTKAQIDKAIKTSAGNLKLTVRTSKTPKKNIKAVVKQDAALKSLLQEVKEAGYTVKYKFYRSESKKSGYAARLTKTTGVYLNTEGQANAKYYYKAKLQILDREGKTVAETLLKQCRFGVRIWTKGQK